MNQRKIKFRAWHTELKKMFSAEEMGQDELTINPDGRGFVNVSGDSPKLSQYAGEKMIPMQFTGLKDKNGKEIYEGDTVEYENQIGTIVWIEDHWGVLVKQEGFEKEGNWTWMGIKDRNFEVIGNIYENPEFLK